MQAKDERSSREMVRRGLLLEGLDHPVDLNAVDWHVRQHNPSVGTAEVQDETLEVIRSLVNDGLVRLGAQVMLGEHLGGVATEGERFVAWDQPLERSMHKISHDYVKHYDDPERWMYAVWMQLTDKGEQFARTVEQADAESYRKFE
ncbi:hypothetical protein LFT51_26805 [Mycobacterium intracellulare subsp. chimaera]|uniref:Uncharacterized protein n=1 Tax=Mycobacterium intracellulare subsp. chimaera TaxID=222805 RepID=A0A220Y398_MYCIT|nr:hypothetical protein [Mycobacterium intracellulare]ETZ26953.1 hypothetical protein L842_5139 [Mycobacterium intracellulare MIN_052511_1280]ASL11886.1 hypothetical protein MYCODSM44623_05211 [Mycobacterium intracellulare subsp. chimaera]ASL17802.1 hypothetical protein MYCOZU2_05456 [Mycobacterium intracellulare subsp. chimaera]ASL23835.1 hypothetical protein MYCOZU1_05473 [Mycobacterium intracellulare subsp. chimaera]MDM3905109.1 hypothetical protein [Mycobacterium intracellulare subsp. chim